MTWNINGVRARSVELQQLIAREQPDVLCLQEVKASPEQVPEELRALPGYWQRWHGHKGYSGVALLLKKATFPQRPRFSHPEFDMETRVVEARAGSLAFASIYVPNGGKDFDAKLKFLEALDRYSAGAQAAGLQLTICGDLNVALEERDVHVSLRKNRDLIGCTPVEREHLRNIMSRGALQDTHRKFEPDNDQLFTWWAPWRNQKQKNIGWRIDYVLAAAPIAATAQSCAVQREFGTSDHGPLVAVFDQAVPPYDAAPEPEPQAAPAPPGQIPLL